MISTFFLFYWINVVLAQRYLKSSKCCTKMMESETLESVWYSLISVTKIIKYKPYSYTAVCNYQVLPGLFWSHAWLMWRIQSGIQLTSSTFYNALIHEKKKSANLTWVFPTRQNLRTPMFKVILRHVAPFFKGEGKYIIFTNKNR